MQLSYGLVAVNVFLIGSASQNAWVLLMRPGIAFGFNAFTFLVSVITLWMMKGDQPKRAIPKTDKAESVWSAIWDGLLYVSHDAVLRTFFLITAAITLLINGPFGIGVPVLAEMRFAEGAAAFGIITFITWLQSRTPPAMLGRMMSLLMFALVGLSPISTALAGALIKLDTTMLLASAGGLLVAITLVSLFNPAVRAMGLEKQGLGVTEG